jgi:hypothetical protein
VSVSSLGDYHLEIFALNDHRLVARPVAASDKIDDIARQPVAAGFLASGQRSRTALDEKSRRSRLFTVTRKARPMIGLTTKW